MKNEKRGKLTVNHVFNFAEAGSQQSLLISPGGAFGLELSKETGLLVLRLLLGLLEKLRLLRQLRDQPVTLFGQLALVRLLGTQRGVGFAQLLLQGGVGLCKGRRRKRHQQSTRRDTVAGEIRPDCSAIGPNLGDYSPRVRQCAPAKKKNLLRLSDRSAARLLNSSTLRLKAVARRL